MEDEREYPVKLAYLCGRRGGTCARCSGTRGSAPPAAAQRPRCPRTCAATWDDTSGRSPATCMCSHSAVTRMGRIPSSPFEGCRYQGDQPQNGHTLPRAEDSSESCGSEETPVVEPAELLASPFLLALLLLQGSLAIQKHLHACKDHGIVGFQVEYADIHALRQ